MVLSVGGIDAWQLEALRSVGHAGRLRANVSTTVAEGLASLPAFDRWEGQGAEAAKAAIGQTRAHLMAHAEDAWTVARAADTAADRLTGVKARLYDLRDAAWRAGMQIDPMTSAVLPGPNFRGSAIEAAMKAAQLQPHVDAVVADANAIDAELAQAISGSSPPIALASRYDIPAGRIIWCEPGPRGGPWAFHCEVLYPDGTTDMYYTDDDESGGHL